MNTDDRGRNLADAEYRRRKQFYNQSRKSNVLSDRQLAITALLERVVEVWIEEGAFEEGTAVHLMRLVEEHIAETDRQFDDKYRRDDV